MQGTRNGIYTLDFELSVDEYDFQIPILISLKQNYPNPFNSSTKIAYSLSKNSFVKLTVFDISGKKIKRLVNEIKNTGEHSVMWDGTDLNNKSVPSGVYFYVLKNDQGLF